MTAQGRQAATVSAPGSPRRRAMKAVASRTATLSTSTLTKPLLHLLLGVIAAIGDQFLSQTAARRNELPHTLLHFANPVPMGFDHQHMTLDAQEHGVSGFQAQLAANLGRDHDAAVDIQARFDISRFCDIIFHSDTNILMT